MDRKQELLDKIAEVEQMRAELLSDIERETKKLDNLKNSAKAMEDAIESYKKSIIDEMLSDGVIKEEIGSLVLTVMKKKQPVIVSCKVDDLPEQFISETTIVKRQANKEAIRKAIQNKEPGIGNFARLGEQYTLKIGGNF